MEGHRRWRQSVEQDESRLAHIHDQQHVWFPVQKHGRHKIVPIMGGGPSSWDSLVAGLTVAAIDAGFELIRVANLSQWPVLESLKAIGQRARRAHLRFDVVSASGSTADVFSNSSPTELAGFLVDVLRVMSGPQGRRDSAREKADLVAVADLLQPPVSIVKLTSALDVVLGALNPVAPALLDQTEQRKLRDFHHDVVSQRRQTADRLDGLHADLREVVRYGQAPGSKSLEFGNGSVNVRALEVDASQAIHEFEMGREIVAGLMARSFAKRSSKLELLVIAGADKLATEVLENLKGSAEQMGKQLVLLFAEITPAAQRSLGAGGSDFAAFLRLPNADDAEIAARHFGREFTFVVNGISIADGQTEEWNSSYGMTSTESTSHTRQFAHVFGSSISRTMGYSNSNTKGVGGGSSHVVTQSTGRVHEYIVQPEVFQHLDDFAVLFVEGKCAVLANCDYKLRNNARTSAVALVVA